MLNRTPRRFAKLAMSLAIAGAVTGATGAAALAQGATPDATPIEPGDSFCLSPGVATTGGATPMASPVSGDILHATPVGEVADLPEGTVVEDQAVIADATAAIENLYACYNEGDGAAVVALFTDSGLNAAYGAGDRETIAAQVTALSGAAEAGDVEVAEVVDYGDGRLGVTYQVTLGQQTFNFTDVLVRSDAIWLVDDRVENSPQTDLSSTTAAIRTSEENGVLAFEITPNPIAVQDAVMLQVSNQGENTHYLQLFQTPEGFDGSMLVDADLSSLPEDVTFVGTESVMPGEFSTALFEGLEEGTYTLVGYPIDVTGEPLGEGTATELTIGPPFDPNA